MTFGIELGVLTVVLICFGNFVLPWLPVVILVALMTSVFVTGVCLAPALRNVYFRDLTYLWGIATQAWFFLTPIVYPVSAVEKRLHGLPYKLYSNQPMAVVVRMFRHPDVRPARPPPRWTSACSPPTARSPWPSAGGSSSASRAASPKSCDAVWAAMVRQSRTRRRPRRGRRRAGRCRACPCCP